MQNRKSHLVLLCFYFLGKGKMVFSNSLLNFKFHLLPTERACKGSLQGTPKVETKEGKEPRTTNIFKQLFPLSAGCK